MSEALKTAITALANKATEATKSDDAMKFAQAAYSLAQAAGVLDMIKKLPIVSAASVERP